jgi:serine/threonine protein kinase
MPALRQHVIGCDVCARTLASFKASTLSVAVAPVAAPNVIGPPSSPTLPLGAFTYLLPAEHPGEIGRLGPYRILRVLGEGGMGVVFQARDPLLDRTVALKVMKPDGATDLSRQRFLQEGKVAARLQHDHIVTIYQVGEDRGVPYLAMQFLEGEALDRRLKRDGKMPIREVLRIGREVAEGLAAAHARGLIHRDIKPANIWLETQLNGLSRVKILDFGLARAIHDKSTHLTRTGVIMGTPDYMAPEQARGGNLDARCDIFSLGCVMYHMVTGRKPFHGEDVMATLLALATEEPLPLRQLTPEIPWEFEDRIKAMMAKSPGDRPPTAQAVVDELTHLEENFGSLSRSRGAATPPIQAPPAPGGMPRAPLRRAPRRTVNPGASVDDLLRDSKTINETPSRSTPPSNPADSGSTTAPLAKHGLSEWTGEQAPVVTPRKPANPRRPQTPPDLAMTVPMPPKEAPTPKMPPAAPAVEAPPGKGGACPRCGSKRYSGGPMGWCQACGYAPGMPESTTESETKEALERRRKEQSRAWVITLVIGAAAVVLVTFVVKQFIRMGTQDWKIWIWFQMTAGLASFMGSFIWAYAMVWKYNDDQSFLPLFCKPFYFLRLTFQLHHLTRNPICFGAWGLTMAIAIAVVVGDPWYWITGGKMPAGMPAYTVAMQKSRTVAEGQNGTFAVVGFRLEGGALTSVLLAEEKDGKLHYVGSTGRVAESTTTDGMAPALIDLLRANSVVPGLSMPNVKWVEPKVQCTVQYTERSPAGQLVEPVILGWNKRW